MSSQKIPLLTLTVIAAGAVSAHRFVTFAGAQLAAAGGLALGVSTFDAVANDDLGVDVIGTTVVESGAAVAVGDAIVSDASGRAIENPAVGTEAVLGYALDAATAAGEFIEVLLVRS
ncbi:DUF2190 family protein [Eoetvoesiella caeni]